MTKIVTQDGKQYMECLVHKIEVKYSKSIEHTIPFVDLVGDGQLREWSAPYHGSSKTKLYHLYITSSETLKEGDLCLNVKTGEIFRVNGFVKHIRPECRKLIATTCTMLSVENIPSVQDKFIKEYIEEHNMGLVMIETFVEVEDNRPDYSGWNGIDALQDGDKYKDDYTITLDSNGCIICLNELNQESEEEHITEMLLKAKVAPTNKQAILGSLNKDHYYGFEAKLFDSGRVSLQNIVNLATNKVLKDEDNVALSFEYNSMNGFFKSWGNVTALNKTEKFQLSISITQKKGFRPKGDQNITKDERW